MIPALISWATVSYGPRSCPWRWDFAWPEWRLLIEVQGGIWIPSGHTTGQGIARDIEKHNAATLAGWRVLYVTREMIEEGSAIRMIEEVLDEEAS